MNMSSSRLAMLCVLAPMLFGAAVTAHAQASRADAEHACAHDAFRLCSEFIPNEDTTGACLRRHIAGLSPECHAVMAVGRGGHGHVHHRGHHRR